MQTFAATLATTRVELRARRERRAELRRIERDLATYTSSGDRLELDAIVARAPVEDAVLLQRIISRQRVA